MNVEPTENVLDESKAMTSTVTNGQLCTYYVKYIYLLHQAKLRTEPRSNPMSLLVVHDVIIDEEFREKKMFYSIMDLLLKKKSMVL